MNQDQKGQVKRQIGKAQRKIFSIYPFKTERGKREKKRKERDIYKSCLRLRPYDFILIFEFWERAGFFLYPEIGPEQSSVLGFGFDFDFSPFYIKFESGLEYGLFYGFILVFLFQFFLLLVLYPIFLLFFFLFPLFFFLFFFSSIIFSFLSLFPFSF